MEAYVAVIVVVMFFAMVGTIVTLKKLVYREIKRYKAVIARENEHV